MQTTKYSGSLNVDTQAAIDIIGRIQINATREDILQALKETGITHTNAVEILIFLPIAFIRNWMHNLNWPQTYVEISSDNKKRKINYSDNHSFSIIFEESKKYFSTKPNTNTILKVCNMSSELQSINKMLNDGGNLKDIEILDTIIYR